MAFITGLIASLQQRGISGQGEVGNFSRSICRALALVDCGLTRIILLWDRMGVKERLLKIANATSLLTLCVEKWFANLRNYAGINPDQVQAAEIRNVLLERVSQGLRLKSSGTRVNEAYRVPGGVSNPTHVRVDQLGFGRQKKRNRKVRSEEEKQLTAEIKRDLNDVCRNLFRAWQCAVPTHRALEESGTAPGAITVMSACNDPQAASDDAVEVYHSILGCWFH